MTSSKTQMTSSKNQMTSSKTQMTSSKTQMTSSKTKLFSSKSKNDFFQANHYFEFIDQTPISKYEQMINALLSFKQDSDQPSNLAEIDLRGLKEEECMHILLSFGFDNKMLANIDRWSMIFLIRHILENKQ
jgi:DNA-nicking Smr family endonuclease